MNQLARFHRAAGLLTLLVFLLTGAYLRCVAHLAELPDRRHLMFVSRHIYILGNALVHLALAAYLVPRPTRAGRAAQWIGSALLALSSVLLIGAFAYEPIAGRPRTAVSTFGLYALLPGVLLHVAPALRRRPAS